jgi:hypothetical protein
MEIYFKFCLFKEGSMELLLRSSYLIGVLLLVRKQNALLCIRCHYSRIVTYNLYPSDLDRTDIHDVDF